MEEPRVEPTSAIPRALPQDRDAKTLRPKNADPGSTEQECGCAYDHEENAITLCNMHAGAPQDRDAVVGEGAVVDAARAWVAHEAACQSHYDECSEGLDLYAKLRDAVARLAPPQRAPAKPKGNDDGE